MGARLAGPAIGTGTISAAETDDLGYTRLLDGGSADFLWAFITVTGSGGCTLRPVYEMFDAQYQDASQDFVIAAEGSYFREFKALSQVRQGVKVVSLDADTTVSIMCALATSQ